MIPRNLTISQKPNPNRTSVEQFNKVRSKGTRNSLRFRILCEKCGIMLKHGGSQKGHRKVCKGKKGIK